MLNGLLQDVYNNLPGHLADGQDTRDTAFIKDRQMAEVSICHRSHSYLPDLQRLVGITLQFHVPYVRPLLFR